MCPTLTLLTPLSIHTYVNGHTYMNGASSCRIKTTATASRQKFLSKFSPIPPYGERETIVLRIMLPEFIFSVGSSMQDLSCDDLNFINGAESMTSANAKTEVGSSEQSAASNNNGFNKLMFSNEETHKLDSPLIRGIKLENADDKIGCSSLFLPKLDQQQIPQSIKCEETAEPKWPVASSSIFNRNGTTLSNQQHSKQIYNDQTYSKFQNQRQHQRHQNHHQLLLQSSDDPLISYGANSVINDDDHSVELRHLLTAASSNGQQQQKSQHYSQPATARKAAVITQAQPTSNCQRRPKNSCSSLTKQQLKVKAELMSAASQKQKLQEALNTSPPQLPMPTRTKSKKRSQPTSSTMVSSNNNGLMKLRFHHQALPPEYLSHYEATQRRLCQDAPLPRIASSAMANSPTTYVVKAAQTVKLPPPKTSNENVRSWLQKIAEIQRAAQQQQHQKSRQQSPPSKVSAQHSSGQGSHASPNNQRESYYTNARSRSPSGTKPASPINCLTKHNRSPTSTLNRAFNYADLPYMGEITLNNTKPRRGRKPKKADICHLIYKNYGKTIFAGAARDPILQPPSHQLKFDQPSAIEEEPINLCLRDYQKTLDLCSSSSGEGENCDGASNDDAADFLSDESQSDFNFTRTPVDALTDTMLATNMKASMPSGFEGKTISTDCPSDPLLHPVTAYQKLIESGMLLKQADGTLPTTFAGFPIETIEKDNQIALKIPIPSGFFLTPKQEPKRTSCSSCSSTPIPIDYSLQEIEAISTPSSIKSEHQFIAATPSHNYTGLPQKRKRSAIFIPPMPAENTTNPANQVSICKFKFTGGAKPTLQEKKMLSVDSDGNYRYYSGTGDKANRGYEFFPRESLQQSVGFLPGVNGAAEEKTSIDIPPPSADLTNELLQIPESPTSNLLLPAVTPTTSIASASANTVDSMPSSNTHYTLKSNINHSHKTSTGSSSSHETSIHKASQPATVVSMYQRNKKRSLTSSLRSPSQREKLEKTFKEKGFLIQTQRLESAEGATYCKFRQLKKFTRYLFRNWKDYLPDGKEPPSHQTDGQQAALESFLTESCLSESPIDKNEWKTLEENN